MHTDFLNENRIDKAVRFALYLLFGLLPWVSLPMDSLDVQRPESPLSWIFQVFHISIPLGRVAGMHGKFTLMAGLACLIFFLWLARIIVSSEVKIVTTPLDKPVLLFLGVVALSTLFSDDVGKALLGWDRHREGFVAFGVYVLIYFAVVNFVNRKEYLRKLILALSAGLAISNLQGVFQIVTGGTEFGSRVTASFTDPNFYGGFLVMMIPLVVAFASYSRKLYEKMVLGSIALTSFALLVFTFSRIAYVALFLSFLCASVFLFSSRRSKYIPTALIVALSLVMVVLLLGMFVPKESQAHFVQRISSSSFIEGFRTRMGLWRLSWNYVFDRPLLGYGPDRYRFATGNSGGYGGAHNEYLYYVVTLGWTGLISFLLLIGAYLVNSVKLFPKEDEFTGLRIGCMAGVIGYLTYVLATYNIPFVAIYFWLLLGITLLPKSFAPGSTLYLRLKPLPNRVRGLVLVLVSALSLGSFAQILRLPAGALCWSKARTLWAEGKKESAVEASQRAVMLVPDSEPYWTDLGGEALYLAKRGQREFLPLAAISLEKVVSQLNKGESPTWFYLGEAYRLAGKQEKAKSAYKKAIALGTSDLVTQKAVVILSEQYQQ